MSRVSESQRQSNDEENLCPDLPPIAPEDLAGLGVEPQLIPFILSTILHAENLPSGSSTLNPAEAENLVEALDKVRLPPRIPPRAANLPND